MSLGNEKFINTIKELTEKANEPIRRIIEWNNKLMESIYDSINKIREGIMKISSVTDRLEEISEKLDKFEQFT